MFSEIVSCDIIPFSIVRVCEGTKGPLRFFSSQFFYEHTHSKRSSPGGILMHYLLRTADGGLKILRCSVNIIVAWLNCTVKVVHTVFRVPWGNVGKRLARSHIFQLKKSEVEHHWPNSSFSMFQKLFLHRTFLEQEYLCSMSNAAMLLLEPWKHFHTQVHMLRFPSFFRFAVENKSIPFNCFPLSNYRTGCWRGEPEFLLNVSSLQFRVLVDYCEICFPFIDDRFHFLPVMVSSGTKWGACRSAQNERDDANVAVTRGGVRV